MTDAATNKVALVVGAGDFLGAAIARRFGREGYHVAARAGGATSRGW